MAIAYIYNLLRKVFFREKGMPNFKLMKPSTGARILGGDKRRKRDEKLLYFKNLHNKLMFYTILLLFLSVEYS